MLAKVMPLWMNTSIAIFKDPEASKAWGWVQEMYGFAIGLWLGGIKHVDLYLHMMSQVSGWAGWLGGERGCSILPPF